MRLTSLCMLGLAAVLAMASPAFATVPISSDPIVAPASVAIPDCSPVIGRPTVMFMVDANHACDPAILAVADICLTKVSTGLEIAMPPDPVDAECSSTPLRSPPD